MNTDPAAEDALIPLSALQHQLFCPRQCALIHVEQQWAEDGATAEGRLLHERVDTGPGETRPGIRVARGVALRSLAFGVSGRADVVEFLGRPPRPFPVEYKRGKPKPHRADEVQLCAQAICLEEMLSTEVAEGALFYGQTRRRLTVRFDAALRALTAETAAPRAPTSPPGARRRRCRCRAAAPVRCSQPASRSVWQHPRAWRAGCWHKSAPDRVRRMLNVLYVTSEDAWLRKDGANVVVEDRNTGLCAGDEGHEPSPSHGAWIETFLMRAI